MARRPNVFRPQHLASRREQRQAADRKRGSARTRGYTHEWDKAAAAFRQMHPLCCMCDADGVVTASEVVDHIVPHRGDMRLFWDPSNWQALCKAHHDGQKQREERSGGAKGHACLSPGL